MADFQGLETSVQKLLKEHNDLVLNACLKINDYILLSETTMTKNLLLPPPPLLPPSSSDLWFRYQTHQSSPPSEAKITTRKKPPKQLNIWLNSFPFALPAIFFSLLSPYENELKEKKLKMVHLFCAVLHSLELETKPSSSYSMIKQSISFHRLQDFSRNFFTKPPENPWNVTIICKNQIHQTKTFPHPSNYDLQNRHLSWSKIQPGSGQCPVQLIHDEQSGKFLACCFKLDSEH